jgi:hypothetical protein
LPWDATIIKFAMGCNDGCREGVCIAGIGHNFANGSLEFSHTIFPLGSVITKPVLVNKQELPAFAKSAKE